MEKQSILVIGVSSPYAEAIATAFRHAGYRTSYAEDMSSAGAIVQYPAVAVVEVSREDDDTFQALLAMSKLIRGRPIVVLVEDVGAEFAFRLSRLGIVDVIELPAPKEDLAARVVGQLASPPDMDTHIDLTGESRPVRELKDEIRSASMVESKILLQGETGTGKGVVARQIHALSRKSNAPFIHVDCSALSPTLIESELFGHERGAFTGANTVHRGRFETAGRGTVFLDEIGDLDASLQTKLLRVLEDYTFERVGGTRSLPMTARIIAATCHDLRQAVQERRFRVDLYYRLAVITLKIPPLRERMSDIPLLVQAGLQRISGRMGVPVPRVSDEFYECLADHHWPGNVRELMNLIERVLVRRRVDILTPEDLEGWPDESGLESDPAAPLSLAGFEPGDEEAMIRTALLAAGGNVSRAARRLGTKRGTLRYKIEKYGLRDIVPKD